MSDFIPPARCECCNQQLPGTTGTQRMTTEELNAALNDGKINHFEIDCDGVYWWNHADGEHFARIEVLP